MSLFSFFELIGDRFATEMIVVVRLLDGGWFISEPQLLCRKTGCTNREAEHGEPFQHSQMCDISEFVGGGEGRYSSRLSSRFACVPLLGEIGNRQKKTTSSAINFRGIDEKIERPFQTISIVFRSMKGGSLILNCQLAVALCAPVRRAGRND
jgi:hypothetical protein